MQSVLYKITFPSDVKYHTVVISKFGHCIKFLCWALGPPGARGPRFIEPPEPPGIYATGVDAPAVEGVNIRL